MLLISTGKVRRKSCAEPLPGLNRPKSEVHEPRPGWPSQGYMKVARHDSVVTTSCCDGGNVHLQEDGLVVPSYFSGRCGRNFDGHATARRCSASATHPSHRGARLNPDVHRRLGCCHVQVGVEVAAFNVEAALSCPLNRDADVLTRVPAVELRPQVFCSCTPHCGGAHGCRRTALAPVVGYHRIARRRSLPSPC